VFQIDLYNGIPNVTVWRVTKTFKGVQYVHGAERWIVCVNVFVTLVTRKDLENRCKAFFETPCIYIYLFIYLLPAEMAVNIIKQLRTGRSEIGVLFPSGASDFYFPLSFPTGSGVRTVSYAMGRRDLSSGSKTAEACI
jgi:hypothetical protein